MRESLSVTVSLDVEEEGLFSGRYRCKDVTVENVACLTQLSGLFERGIRPTLFCAYPVLQDAGARAILEKLLPHVEIGAHLHHWNTPPIAQNIPASGELFAVPAYQAPLPSLEEKLEHLLRLGRDFLGRDLTSFRMGRWDLHRPLLPILARHGIRCDASVRPLHTHTNKNKGPDHFGAPVDPYWMQIDDARILEVPLTVAPIFGPLALLPQKFAPVKRIASGMRHWGALALLPINHPLWLLKLTTMLHVSNGGRVLSLTWHSSEMMPGGAPHVPDKAAVRDFMRKLDLYLDWLERNFSISYASMEQLAQGAHPDAPLPSYACDWIWQTRHDSAS